MILHHRQRYVVPLLVVVVVVVVLIVSGWSCYTAFDGVLVAASTVSSSSLLDHQHPPRPRPRPRHTFVRGLRHEGRTQAEESKTTATTATTATTTSTSTTVTAARIASAAAAIASRSVQEAELPTAEEPLALVVSVGKTKKRRRKEDTEKKEESTKKVSSVSGSTEAPSSSVPTVSTTAVPSTRFPSIATTTVPTPTPSSPSSVALLETTTTTTSPSRNSSRRRVELLPFSVVVDGAFQDEKEYIRDELQYYLFQYYQKQNAELLSRLESVILENVSHTVLPNEDTTKEAMVSRLGYTGHAGMSRSASAGLATPDEDKDEDHVEGLDETARRTDAVVHAVQIAALEDTVALQQHFLQFFTLARLGALDQEPVVVMSVQIDDRAPHFLHYTNTWETIDEILLDEEEEEDPTLSSTTAASMSTEDTHASSKSLYLGIGTVVLILLTGGLLGFAWRYKKQRQRSYHRGQRLKGGEHDFDHNTTNTNEGITRMRDVDDVDHYDETQDEPSEMEAALYHTAIERSDSTTHGRKKLSPFTYLYDKSKRLLTSTATGGFGATQPETTRATTLTTIHLQYHPQPRNSCLHTTDTNNTHTAAHKDKTTAVSLHENEDEDSMMGYSLVSREKENGSTSGVGVRDTNNNKTINTGNDLTHDVVDDDDDDDDDKEESKDSVARQRYSGNVAVEDGIAIGADDVSVVSSELSYRTNPMIPQHTNGGDNPSSQQQQQQQLVLHDTIFAVASSPHTHRYPSLLGGADDDVSDAPSDEQYTHPLD